MMLTWTEILLISMILAGFGFGAFVVLKHLSAAARGSSFGTDAALTRSELRREIQAAVTEANEPLLRRLEDLERRQTQGSEAASRGTPAPEPPSVRRAPHDPDA